jgi:hypothetical protein
MEEADARIDLAGLSPRDVVTWKSPDGLAEEAL